MDQLNNIAENEVRTTTTKQPKTQQTNTARQKRAWAPLPPGEVHNDDHILLLIAYTFRENREFVFIIIVQFMMSANNRTRFCLEGRIRLFVHYTISLSSLCKLIWRHWTYKMPVRYILSSVWVRYGIFSQLSIMQYVGLCVFSLPSSLVMIERIYILCLIIIIKSEVWTITIVWG